MSVTVTFKEDEASQLKNALEMYETRLKAVSFLKYQDTGYEQAPYEPITEEQYKEMSAKITPIQRIVTDEAGVGTKYCDGESCEIWKLIYKGEIMFKPVNRHILIELPKKPIETNTMVLLPEDYKPEEQRYSEVKVLKAADDVRFELCQNNKIIIDRSMVEQISIGSTNYDVILDNYVIGITE